MYHPVPMSSPIISTLDKINLGEHTEDSITNSVINTLGDVASDIYSTLNDNNVNSQIYNFNEDQLINSINNLQNSSNVSSSSFKLDKLPNLEHLRSSCVYDINTLIFCLYGLELQRDSYLQSVKNNSAGADSENLPQKDIILEKPFNFQKFPEEKFENVDLKYPKFGKKDYKAITDDKKPFPSAKVFPKPIDFKSKDKQLVQFNFAAPLPSTSLITSRFTHLEEKNENNLSFIASSPTQTKKTESGLLVGSEKAVKGPVPNMKYPSLLEQDNHPLHQSVQQTAPTEEKSFFERVLGRDLEEEEFLPLHRPQQQNTIEPAWQYKDPTGDIQGPFTSRQMYEWWEQNFFPPNLLVRYSPNMAWTSYRNLYPAPMTPFLSPPRKIVTKPPAERPARLSSDEEALDIARQMRLLLVSTDIHSNPNFASKSLNNNKNYTEPPNHPRRHSIDYNDKKQPQLSYQNSFSDSYSSRVNSFPMNMSSHSHQGSLPEVPVIRDEYSQLNRKSSLNVSPSVPQIGWSIEKPKAEPLAEIMAKQASESITRVSVNHESSIQSDFPPIGYKHTGGNSVDSFMRYEDPSSNASAGMSWARAVGGKASSTTSSTSDTLKKQYSPQRSAWDTNRPNGLPLSSWIREDKIEKPKSDYAPSVDSNVNSPLDFNRILEEWEIKIDPSLLGILFSLKNEANILIFLKHAAKGSTEKHSSFAAYLNQLRENYPAEWAQMLQETTIKSSKASFKNKK